MKCNSEPEDLQTHPDGFQIRKNLTRSTTSPSMSASPSRRTSYVVPSVATSANVLPYGDDFEKLVVNTGMLTREVLYRLVMQERHRTR